MSLKTYSGNCSLLSLSFREEDKIKTNFCHTHFSNLGQELAFLLSSICTAVLY